MALVTGRSDVAALWDEALDSYTKIAEVDIRGVLSSLSNTTNINAELQNQLESFKGFRHDKGMVDMFRTIIADNANYIQAVANQVANAATAAFPPSSAILTAFTYVMTASKHVSEDYNTIQSFFDMMKSFLRRLALLEGKIPPREEFQRDLINVFSSILTISALAYSYRQKGRFKAWAASLFHGNDPKLSDAFNGLQENLKGLEWAVMMQTLRTSLDTHDETKSIHQDLTSVRDSLDKNTSITMQTWTTVADASSGVDELLRLVRQQSKTDLMQEHELKSRASRPANFALLRGLVGSWADGAMQQRMQELEQSSVRGVFQWIKEDPQFLKVVNNKERLLWVSGASGMGKSTMAFTMFRHLRETFINDPSVSVAPFFFDQEYPETRSAQIMLKWCCVRAAEKDARYCAETLRDVRSRGGDGEDSETSDDEDVFDSTFDEDWDLFFASKFSTDTRRRHIMVLDGIDEMPEEDFSKLLELFGKLRDGKCTVQVVATCDPSREDRLGKVLTSRVDLTKERIRRDMRDVALSQAKTLPRLQKLRANFGRAVARKVSTQADSFLYVTHAMQRLNGIGYESLIRKELAALPPDTTGLYKVLIQDCLKNRSPGDRGILRGLLSWVAYAKFRLSIAEATLLINIIREEHSISIDEAFDGPLSMLLRISGRGYREDRESHSGDSDDESHSDADMADDAASIAEGARNFIHFHERSMKAYFREAVDDPLGLRCSPSEGHAIIFRLTSVMLRSDSQYGPNSLLQMMTTSESVAHAGLTQASATWSLAHLLEIDIDAISDELAKVVLQSLFDIFANKNGGLRFLEGTVGVSSTVLKGRGAELPRVLAALKAWAKRALQLPPSSLPDDVLAWFQPLAEEPRRVFVPLARAHIQNWYSSQDSLSACRSFYAANHALREGRSLPELQQNAALRSYLEELEKSGYRVIQGSLEMVAGAFPDIERTASSFYGIAMAMARLGRFPQAIKQIDNGLGLAAISDTEKLRLLQCKGQSLFGLSCRTSDEDERRTSLGGAVDTLGMAIEMHRKIEAAGAATDLDRVLIVRAFITHAEAAAESGRFDLVVQSIKDAASSPFGQVEVEALRGIISALAEAEQYQLAIDVLTAVSKSDLASYFAQVRAQEHVQKSAARSGQGKQLLDLYATAINWGADAPRAFTFINKIYVQLDAASFASRVMNDAEEAKKILRAIIRDPQAHFLLVQPACHRLAELLLEDFRLSSDPEKKQAALEETRSLQARLAEVMGSDFKPAESPISVTLAHMLRKLGPATDLADILQATFRSCMELLTDDIGYNDSSTLRLLTVVLSCVPGLEKQAQVAMTAQLYILDRDAHEKDLAKQKLAKKGAEAGTESDGHAGAQGASATSPGVPGEQPTAPADDMAEGLMNDTGFYCNVCRKVTRSWAQNGSNMCIYCIDCDICDDCFATRKAEEEGGPSSDWRVVCPKGHRHVHAPVEGWRGVKDGMLRIGDAEVHFKDWLKDLEIAWGGYWEEFWTTKAP